MKIRRMKALIVFFIFGSICLFANTSAFSDENVQNFQSFLTIEKGDVNGNGIVDILDVMVLRFYVEGFPQNPFYPEASDVDCDDDIDNLDVDLIESYLNGDVPDLVCPTYHGKLNFKPFYQPWTQYEAYSSDRFTLYSADTLDQNQVARFLSNVETAYDIQATVTPEWIDRVEKQPDLVKSSKTIAFIRGETCGAGCGDQHRVEVSDWIFNDPTHISSRENMWIFYYEMQRSGDPNAYEWYDYLFYEAANTDWCSAFSHSVAIICSESIGTGPHHYNVNYVKSALPEWVAMKSEQTWVDLLDSGTGVFERADGSKQGINDLFGAMLAQMMHLYGIEYFRDLTEELLTPDKYPTAQSGHLQACNFMKASNVITGGDSNDLFVNQWRFPSGADICGIMP